MDKYSGLPSWIQKSKKTLKQTQEWQTFTMKLYDVVHHQMHEMGISSFHDLTPPEKELLLQRGFYALRKTEAYHNLLETVSETLDESVSREADKLSKDTVQTKSRIEILQDECGKAVTALLQKWPDSKSSLRQCLNVDIPLELRFVMWKNFLKSAKVKEEYFMLVASNPKKLVSPMDFEISQKCKMLLASDPTLKGIPNKSYVYSAMKHILSYYHNTIGGPDPLVETDFLLAIPIAVCMLAAKHMLVKGDPQKSITTESLGSAVEQFFTFMDKRPDYAMSMKVEGLINMCAKTGNLVHAQDAALAKSIENFRVDSKIVTERSLETVLSNLLHPVVRSMFVGYFPIDTVLHMWDMYILGIGHTSYDAVPYLCATLFLLLRKELLACKSVKEASTVIIKRCRSIEKEQLIIALRQFNFEKQLKQNLDIAEEDYFPVFHPSLKANLAPWKYWYSEKIIDQVQKEQAGRTTKTHPKSAHEERRQHLEHESYSENHATTTLELEEEASRLRAERDLLVEDIEKEKRLRVEMQQHADDEIEMLQRRLNMLQKKNSQVIPEKTVVIPVPAPEQHAPQKPDTPTSDPPPEPVTEEKPPTPKPTTPPPEKPATPTQTPKEITPETAKAQKTTDDFVKKMMDVMTHIVQGDAKQRKQLDKATKNDTAKLTAAFKKAQVSVYGKSLGDDEVAQLPETEQAEKAERVKELTTKYLFKLK